MIVLFALIALAAPPSSTLTGQQGTVSWQVSERNGQLRLKGAIDGWDVRHTASQSLVPVRTVYTDPKGGMVALEYGEEGVEVRLSDGSIKKLEAQGLWDVGTLPLRLGYEVALGNTALTAVGVDRKGKLREFDVSKVADEPCGPVACVHVVVRGKGAAGDYWFGPDGGLMRTEGKRGDFSAY